MIKSISNSDLLFNEHPDLLWPKEMKEKRDTLAREYNEQKMRELLADLKNPECVEESDFAELEEIECL